ncbi:COX15/CtaA family protein [Synechococcus sp. M16CYN]|uniref:COX15/CtaA family protein n=1 Tax=Synechococcus sp. M16CYN TaxID=3103139 RepID=UPI003252EAFC
MTTFTLSIVRQQLARLSAHLVVALVALIVIGGATRVMEAGLACPDWPLCYGTLLPYRQMNTQVFLEWFHRLDALIVGIALLVLAVVSLIWRRLLPRWLPWVSFVLVVMVALQGCLGALTVLQLLPSGIVTAHLLLALTLVAILSGITQCLQQPAAIPAPLWWRSFSLLALVAVMGQCLFGARIATTWATQICLTRGDTCNWVALHRSTAILVAGAVLLFVAQALLADGWTRQQWPFLSTAVVLLAGQAGLGAATLHFGLSQPLITTAHQLLAAVLVAVLAALAARRPEPPSVTPFIVEGSTLETCHG